VDLPELRILDVDGPLAYREWDGPEETTFVLVHGLGGSHLSWVQVAAGLAGLGRVLAVDLPGFGWSPRAGRGSGLMDLRRTLSGFIESAASGRVVMCGNSMGGGVAVLQAAVDPASVEGVILAGSVFPPVRGGRPHPLVSGAFALYEFDGLGERFVATRLRKMDPEQAVRLGFKMVAANPEAIPEDVVALHVELARDRRRDPDAPAAFLDAARSMTRLGRRPAIARRAYDGVRCPVLVLHGRRDRFVPAAFAEAELARHPDWRGRIFPDLGHVPQMEAPGRWLAEVADWAADKLSV
jgi:pimeloyl-ACP methyl ester carboxylesterase